jgi:DNA-binding SARP family transcriptional activator/tetratricopeptide (TPR) repeat protein
MATTELSLGLLGPPVVRRNGTPVTFDTRKATALLALLAVTGREHSREQLAELLWPNADGARARASLRRTLSVTAAVMSDGLAISRAAVALDPAAVHVDVHEFESLIGRPDAASLERAAQLYRDDFLAGFVLRDCADFEEWQAAVSEDLRQSLARGLQRLVAACIADGELERAAGHARRWLQLDPLHEPAHQAIIRLHGWTGQRSAAMRQYRSLVRVLDRDLAVRPLPETTQLYDDVRAGRLEPPPSPPPARAAGEPDAREPDAREPDTGEPDVREQATGGSAVPVTWPLVGRDAELAVLHASWQAADRNGAVVAIAGQAGSGKTRLITELRTEAAQAGATVLAARCHDGETALPFVLAADLLRTALAIRPELPGLLPAETAAMAGRLVPALAAAHQDIAVPALDSPVAVTRLYSAIADTLLAVAAAPDHGVTAGPDHGAAAGPDHGAAAGPDHGAAAGPDHRAGLIVVEDVHWADASSLGLLAYLVRRLTDWPLLLVLSWQPEQADQLRVLRTALGEAEAQGLGQTVAPGPLDPAAISALLELDGMPRIEVGRLLAETRGLPMLVREYVEALRSAGPSDDYLSADWWPPASVKDLLRTRLQAVSEPTLQMLTAAAVLGSDNDADLLRAVSGRGEDEIVEAIDEALTRSLLSEIAPPAAHQAPSYGFPYEALRRTAYESATLARRRLLHSRAADILARRYERDPAATRAATVADHLQLAGRDAEAAQWWWRAAEGARELYAHGQAHAHLVRALALGYPQLPGRIALGEVLVVLGRYREALAEFETAAASAGGEDGDRATQAAIEHKLADVHHRLGDWELAEAHLAVVTELVQDAEAGRLARAQADRAVVAYRRGDAGQAAAFGQAALRSARAGHDPEATAQALNVLGMLAARAGDLAAAETYLRDSLAEARQLPELGRAVAALNNLARLLAEVGRGPEALAAAAEALELGSELGDQHRVAALHTNLADLLHANGQHDTAMTHLKEAARRFASVDVGDAPRPEIWTLVEW